MKLLRGKLIDLISYNFVYVYDFGYGLGLGNGYGNDYSDGNGLEKL